MSIEKDRLIDGSIPFLGALVVGKKLKVELILTGIGAPECDDYISHFFRMILASDRKFKIVAIAY